LVKNFKAIHSNIIFAAIIKGIDEFV